MLEYKALLRPQRVHSVVVIAPTCFVKPILLRLITTSSATEAYSKEGRELGNPRRACSKQQPPLITLELAPFNSDYT